MKRSAGISGVIVLACAAGALALLVGWLLAGCATALPRPRPIIAHIVWEPPGACLLPPTCRDGFARVTCDRAGCVCEIHAIWSGTLGQGLEVARHELTHCVQDAAGARDAGHERTAEWVY